MTEGSAGMTEGGAGMTERGPGMAWDAAIGGRGSKKRPVEG